MSARLLIVDDEAAQMKALCSTLEAEGFRTTGFSSPKRALSMLSAGEYDLLLTDLMMPEVDGIELLRSARAIDPELAGIVMTGHGTIDTAVAAMQVGALDYILKPFKLNAILSVIGRALDVRRLRLENAELHRRQIEQAAELATAYRDLEAFSYSVSHDLRAPLRAIRGFTTLYMTDFADSIPADGRALLDRVTAASARMDRLIEDMLNFSRFSRQALHRHPVDLSRIAQRLIADLEAKEPDRKVEIIVGELPGCEGDPSLLEQVLVNLLSNAFKFTRHRPDARIEIGSFERPCEGPQPTERVYYVRDNGAGFDMQFAGKLFGVFQRLHSDSEFEGTGVGLSIVQRILQRHGGRIWAESEPQKGATFFFVL